MKSEKGIVRVVEKERKSYKEDNSARKEPYLLFTHDKKQRTLENIEHMTLSIKM